MSWLSELFGGDHPTNPYSTDQIYQFLAQDIASRYANDPEGYKALYGTLTPYQVAVNGLNNDPSTWNDEQRKLVDSYKAPPPETVTDALPPPPPPPPPPDQPPPPPPYSGPTAREEIDALLPSGFEKTAVTSSMLDPFISSAQKAQKASAQDVIARLLRRGQLTESGRLGAQSALDLQDPGVRTALSNYGEGILGSERDTLRTLANVGRTAAGSQTGEFFDPDPYKSDVDKELASFTTGLPGKFSSGVPTGLYTTANLAGAGGGVTGPENIVYDPYAVEGGQLQSGVEQPGPPTSSKKRTTSVF